MLLNSLTLSARVATPLAVSALAYLFWRYVRRRVDFQGRKDALLLVAYAVTRLGIWLLFAVYMQHYVTSSDPRLFYTPQLEHFLAGDVPIRDFYYPYAPLLMPSMLLPYILVGHSLAGISLFAIIAEGITLVFFLKSTFLLEQRGEISHAWVTDALAVYLLNPATLYWTVFQGYHSIVQTAYFMAALYFLLLGHRTIGYAIGFYGIAGAKLLAVLDWPALMAAGRPALAKLIWGAIPVLVTYGVYQLITGDIFFPIRYHIGYTGEGTIWYLTTLFADLHSFYSAFPGNLVPIFSFGIPFLLGFVFWLKYLQRGVISFSFQAAVGVSTFTMSLFFLCSLYAGSYYIPMLMLPACLVVTCPGLPNRQGVWLVLLISGVGVAGDAIWVSLGQPAALINVLSSTSFSDRFLTSSLVVTIIVRIICFARLAYLGFSVATTNPLHSQTLVLPSQENRKQMSDAISEQIRAVS